MEPRLGVADPAAGSSCGRRTLNGTINAPAQRAFCPRSEASQEQARNEGKEARTKWCPKECHSKTLGPEQSNRDRPAHNSGSNQQYHGIHYRPDPWFSGTGASA